VSPEEINEYDEDLARYVQAVRARKKQRIAEVE
jgi:Tfp pilus assembly protein PilP